MSQPRTLAEFRGANAEKRPDLATAGSTNYGESRPTTQLRRRASSVAGCSGSEEKGRRSLTATLTARRKLCLVGGGVAERMGNRGRAEEDSGGGIFVLLRSDRCGIQRCTEGNGWSTPCGAHALDFGRYYRRRRVPCRPCSASWDLPDSAEIISFHILFDMDFLSFHFFTALSFLSGISNVLIAFHVFLFSFDDGAHACFSF
jgi:hypothetical protein